VTQRKLFIGAVAITVAVGAAFFVTSNSITYADSNTTYVAGQFDWQAGKGVSPIFLDQTQEAAPKDWKQFWKDWLTGTFPGDASTVLGRPTHYGVLSNATGGDRLVGKGRVKIEDGFLISAPFQFTGEQVGNWQHLSFRYKGNKNEFRFYYRVSDDEGTTTSTDAGWVEVTGLTLNNQFHVQKLALNKTGKTFQYKINLKDTSSVATGVVISAKAAAAVATPTTPTPVVSGTIVPTTPSPVGSPVVKREFSIWQRNWRSAVGKEVAIVNPANAKAVTTKCAPAGDQVTTFSWDTYAASTKIGKSVPEIQGDRITATVGAANIDTAYLISQPYTINLLNDGNTIKWSRLNISLAKVAVGSAKVYYRVFDDPAQSTDSATASDWIEVADPNTLSPVKDSCESNFVVAGYRIDTAGKYFQYKVHLAKIKKNGSAVNQSITKIAIFGAEQTTVAVPTTPTPTVSSSVTPTGTLSPSPEASGMGKITLVTRYLPKASPTPGVTPSTAPSVALPDLTTPSPVTTVSPIASPDPNSLLCSQDGETAPNVPVKVKQQTNGNFTAEDEQSDDEGMWQGLDGEIDEFQNGNYQITFGAYQNSIYKLVGFCVTPDNGQHYFKTQADPATGKITIIVRAGLETKVTAIYGLRTQPYIEMEKLAIDSKTIDQALSKQQRVLNRVYPGQQFLYRINYKNTSDAAAKNITILDVIPKEFDVPSDLYDDVDNKYGIRIEIDAQRRTVIKKQIPELKAGESGVMYIPVTLRGSAFDGSES
jgi:uncharacterized repeat protein (TIGR01451 family)